MIVTPIYKKGDRLNPANYRAIYLLSVPGKIFSQVLLNWITQQKRRVFILGEPIWTYSKQCSSHVKFWN